MFDKGLKTSVRYAFDRYILVFLMVFPNWSQSFNLNSMFKIKFLGYEIEADQFFRYDFFLHIH